MNGKDGSTCSCPFATLIILISSSIFTFIIFVTRQGNNYICDTNSILFYGEWYRLFTSPYAAYSLRDVLYFLICVLWLIYLLAQFVPLYLCRKKELQPSTLFFIFLRLTSLFKGAWSCSPFTFLTSPLWGIIPISLMVYIPIRCCCSWGILSSIRIKSVSFFVLLSRWAKRWGDIWED